jgi:hypothetical protein
MRYIHNNETKFIVDYGYYSHPNFEGVFQSLGSVRDGVYFLHLVRFGEKISFSRSVINDFDFLAEMKSIPNFKESDL